MSIHGVRLLVRCRSIFHHSTQQHFSRVVDGKKKRMNVQKIKKVDRNKMMDELDPWVEVKDGASGQIYYWNSKTNATTALGEPKPSSFDAVPPPSSGTLVPSPQQPSDSSITSGLGRVVAEGFAFGVGSSIARGVVGSMFGGSGDHGSGAAGGGDDGFDDFV